MGIGLLGSDIMITVSTGMWWKNVDNF